MNTRKKSLPEGWQVVHAEAVRRLPTRRRGQSILPSMIQERGYLAELAGDLDKAGIRTNEAVIAAGFDQIAEKLEIPPRVSETS